MAKASKSKFWTVTATIVVLICVAIIGWFLYIKFYAPTKLIENTYELGLQETELGDKKYFAEIKLHKNESGNGLECLDIKINTLLDENKMSFYSQGLQYVANSQDSSLDWGYYLDEDEKYISDNNGQWFANKITYYRYFGSWEVGENASLLNYSSSNDYKTTIESTDPIDNDSSFRIDLGGDLYKMKFHLKEDDGDGNSNNYYSEQNLYAEEYMGSNLVGNKAYQLYYYYQNMNAFAKKIYDAIKVLPSGTKQAIVFPFGDMFEYYEYDEDSGSYSNTRIKDSTKVIAEMQSYYVLYVEVVEDGIQKASESLFNCVNRDPNFNISDDSYYDDYFTGTVVLNCYTQNLDFVKIDSTYCYPVIKENFIEENSKYKNNVLLAVYIDLDYLKERGLKFYGIVDDTTFNIFKVYKIYTTETIDGELITTEVNA